MASCAVFFDSRPWISADIPRLNGMLMSTSGKQRNPRSARITRKSCASASIPPPAKQCPCTAATVRHRQRQHPLEQVVDVDHVAEELVGVLGEPVQSPGRWRKNLPVAVVTSARGPSAASTASKARPDLRKPIRMEPVLRVAEIEDEDLAVALPTWAQG